MAQRLATEPEPRVLRWADAAAVRVAFDTGDDSVNLDRCIVDGPARGLYIFPKPRGRGRRWISLELVPNGVLATASSSTRPPRTRCAPT